MTTPSGGGLVGDATIRVRADTDDASRAITRFATTATRSLGSIGPALVPLAGIGAALGTSIPAVAGIAAAVANIAPAATAAATGFVALQLAAGTVRLAMVGVEDAVSAAFATGEGSAEAFRESLERLAPSARATVVELRGMREELTAVQQGVQQRFFEGFAGELRDLSGSVLPILQNGLNSTANTLNTMAIGASDAAQQLAEDGTLGRAISGANQGLFNLRDVPAQVITAFGQLAAAGAPVFDRITQAAANAATGITDALSGAVETGALDDAVQRASDLLASLLPIAQDVFGVLGNLFDAASVGGDDLFQVIGSVLDALNQFTGTQAFQDAISTLAETMGVVGETVAPLLISALEAIAPVFSILGPPVQQLVTALGQGLEPIIAAIAPLLVTAAEGIGQLASAIAPVLPIVGNLIAQLGPILQPILDFLVGQIQLLAPAFLQVATVLQESLQPILAVLPSVIQPILQAFLQLIQAALPVLLELLIALSPTLIQLTILLADLLLVLTPLIVAVLNLATNVLNFLMPAISALIGIVGRIAAVLSNLVSGVIRGVVMPAIRALTALLRGDFSGAFRAARELISNVLRAIGGFFRDMAGVVNTALRNVIGFVRDRVSDIVNFFQDMPGRVTNALSNFASRLRETVRNAVQRAVDATTDRIDRIVEIVDNLPQRAVNALGNLGRTLFDAGKELIQGFIDGILSLGDAVDDAVGGLVDAATGWLPGSPAEKGPLSGSGYVLLRGQRFSEDFARGIEEPQRQVEDASRRLASSSLAGFEGLRSPNLPLSLVPVQAGAQAGALPTGLVVNFTNRGVIGSRTELQDWLTSALDQLARTNRLPQNRNQRQQGRML